MMGLSLNIGGAKDMAIQDLIPILRKLPRSQKWEIMQFLMSDLAKEEITLSRGDRDAVSSLRNSHETTVELASLLAEEVKHKVEMYRGYVQVLMARYAAGDSDEGDVKVELMMDTVRDHYQWMNVGWKGTERIYNCYIHIDIIDGKIWLQQNWTEENPAEDLVRMGVPKEDIVLGLHSPDMRPYTDYGVA